MLQNRPSCIKDFCGKEELEKNLSIYIESALQKDKPLDHCLFYGPPGVGKTTIAFVIANELKQKIKVIQGPEIQEKSDVINILYSISNKNIIFIDEIHSINPKCFEIFYSAMEDFKINIDIGKEFNKKLTSVSIPKFTLIGATTKLGKLPDPFENRFGIVQNISEYNLTEIIDILKFNLKKNEICQNVGDDFLVEIAKRSKGIPRIAKRILSRFLDHYEYEKDINVIFNKIGIYESGLEKIDIEYLKLLFFNKKLGMKSISQLLNVDEKTLSEKIEPYLIKNLYIEKTTNGRILTKKGLKFISKIKN